MSVAPIPVGRAIRPAPTPLVYGCCLGKNAAAARLGLGLAPAHKEDGLIYPSGIQHRVDNLAF